MRESSSLKGLGLSGSAEKDNEPNKTLKLLQRVCWIQQWLHFQAIEISCTETRRRLRYHFLKAFRPAYKKRHSVEGFCGHIPHTKRYPYSDGEKRNQALMQAFVRQQTRVTIMTD